jgi:predicted lipase
MTKY